MTDYLSSLSDDDMNLLGEVVNEKFIVSLRASPSDEDKVMANKIDALIAKAPTTDPMVVYKIFTGIDVSKGGQLVDNAFFFASKTMPTKVPTGSTVLSIIVPKGTPTIESDEWVILSRGVSLDIKPSSNKISDASILNINPVKL